MSVTSQLVRLYRIDQQLRGLRSRLRGAQTFFDEQDKQLQQIEASVASITSQLRQIEATARSNEGELTAMQQRIATLRERMNNAQTSKEHAAFLTEISTLKADVDLKETGGLDTLNKLDELKKELERLNAAKAERSGLRATALKERDERAREISAREAELVAERATVADEIPDRARKVYELRLSLGYEDIMACVEEQDRRNMEYTCGACFTHLPIERVNIVMMKGDLTQCPTCAAILYMEQSLHEAITTAAEKKAKKRAATVDE